MTVLSAESDQRYQALSSDLKPAGAANGAVLHELDTGNVFVFHENAWVLDIRQARAIRMAADL